MTFSNVKIIIDYFPLLLAGFCYLGTLLSQIVSVYLSNRAVLCPGDKLQVSLLSLDNALSLTLFVSTPQSCFSILWLHLSPSESDETSCFSSHFTIGWADCINLLHVTMAAFLSASTHSRSSSCTVQRSAGTSGLGKLIKWFQKFSQKGEWLL